MRLPDHSLLPIRLEMWRPAFSFFTRQNVSTLKIRRPLLFSLRTRSPLGTQFVEARFFFKFFSNAFQIYFKLLPTSSLGARFYIYEMLEGLGMWKIWAHGFRMQKNPQTREGIFWILTDFYRVMWAQSPICTPAQKFHQLASLTLKPSIFKRKSGSI